MKKTFTEILKMGVSLVKEMHKALGISSFLLVPALLAAVILLMDTNHGHPITLGRYIAGYAIALPIFPVYIFMKGCLIEIVYQIDDACKRRKAA
jgi:hypothetical protein